MLEQQANPSILLMISAPSGAGKSSLIRQLISHHPAIQLSVSYTTRAPRSGEVNGREYIFVDETSFQQMIENDEFVEYAQVHQHYYGTPKKELSPFLTQAKDVIAEIDWQGAEKVRAIFPQAVSVFILPPSIDELEKRLRKRGKDSESVIAHRLSKAKQEITKVNDFDFVLVNHDFDECYKALEQVYLASHYLRKSEMDYSHYC